MPSTHSPLTAVVLAGGLGTRLRSHVSQVPKPMAPLGDKPFLEYLFLYLRKQSIERIIISVGYLGEQIVEYFGESYVDTPLVYVSETTRLGTGGAIAGVINECKLPSQIFVLNGDTLFPVDLVSLKQTHDKARADCSIAVFQSADTQRYASIALQQDGRVLSFGDTSGKGTWANGGMYLFNTAALATLCNGKKPPFSLEQDLFPQMLTQQFLVHGFQSDAPFLDIGIPDDYLRGHHFVNQLERHLYL
ncbi:MAG: nucleotidyltransferase family protein [Bdellovibrionales bacterium]|nr:nucleotidyltransferase family protein [Bdellovibrionales bacterium]